MNWQDIYKKYGKNKLMVAFWQFCVADMQKKNMDVVIYTNFSKNNIKDIWGYLIVFAETKGYGLTIDVHSDITSPSSVILCFVSDKNNHKNLLSQGFEESESEQAMLWCADKFFEIGK